MQNLNVTKKAFKDSYVKKWCYKNSFLCFAFLKLRKLEMFFQEPDF